MRQPTPTVSIPLLGAVICCAALFSSCSSDPPRYPESHARFERIVDAVRLLQHAYIEHDKDATRDLLLPLDTMRQWEANVLEDFDAYPAIALDLHIDRIEIDGDRIAVQVSWEGEWKAVADQPGHRARGHGILHWTGTQVILLRGVEGNLPFGMARQQTLS